MTSFFCVYCGRVFDKEKISTPMKQAPGWVWMRDMCPGCGKGFDDWYVSCRFVGEFTRTTRIAAMTAVRHPRVRRKGRYVGHWAMDE